MPEPDPQDPTQDPEAGAPPPDGDAGRAGGPDAVLADLAKERRERRAAEKQLKELNDRLSKFEEASKTETEKLIDRARQEAAAETMSKANLRLVRAEVKAAAAGKIADPDDAVRFLDLADFAPSDDGDIDTKAIAKAVDDLVAAKPYLAADQAPPPAFNGGARRDAGRPDDFNAALRRIAGVHPR
jgi:hypothetical protein